MRPAFDPPELDGVVRLLAEHEAEAGRTLNMAPSENAMSGLARLPLLLDAYNRYFFNESDEPARWHFRGAQGIGQLETQLTLPLLLELGSARFASVRPLSGLSAMTLVLSSLGGPPGSTVVTIDPKVGGHYATAGIARRLGLRVRSLPGPSSHELDYAYATELVAEARPRLVYVDQSHCLFPIDVPRLVEAVRRGHPGALVHVDASHWLGLVFGGVFANPLDGGADSFGGSTHKTFPGPQKAVFLTRRPDLAEQVWLTQDYMISSHHFAATVSLGLALLEFRDHGGASYARAVAANTRGFGALLADRGLAVAAGDRGFSAGHQLWIDPAAEGIPARIASERLFAAGVRVNYLTDLPGFDQPALRVGLNETTRHGIGGDGLRELADIFARAVRAEAPSGELRRRTAALRRSAPRRYGFPIQPDGPLLKRVLELCTSAMLGSPAGQDGEDAY